MSTTVYCKRDHYDLAKIISASWRCYPDSVVMQVFRLESSAPHASDNHPVVFVTRSDSNVQNWQFPLMFQRYASNVSMSHTCHAAAGCVLQAAVSMWDCGCLPFSACLWLDDSAWLVKHLSINVLLRWLGEFGLVTAGVM